MSEADNAQIEANMNKVFSLIREEVAENYTEFWLQNKGLLIKDAFIEGAKWQQEQICTSEFIQHIRATKSDAKARILIRETFK